MTCPSMQQLGPVLIMFKIVLTLPASAYVEIRAYTHELANLCQVFFMNSDFCDATHWLAYLHCSGVTSKPLLHLDVKRLNYIVVTWLLDFILYNMKAQTYCWIPAWEQKWQTLVCPNRCLHYQLRKATWRLPHLGVPGYQRLQSRWVLGWRTRYKTGCFSLWVVCKPIFIYILTRVSLL